MYKIQVYPSKSSLNRAYARIFSNVERKAIKMHFTKLVALLSASFTVPALALEVFAFPCTNQCECNGATLLNIGPNQQSGCVKIDVGLTALAVGLSGSKNDKCTMFTSGDCTGINQDVGITPHNTFGCTNSQIGAFGSLSCASG